MASSLRRNTLCSRLKALLTPQIFDRTLIESGAQTQFYANMGSSALEQGKVDMSNWRKLDSRTLGITRSMISLPSLIVLKILQGAGFDTYLVGGCVRDLLLNKVPKDFDVVTTASLNQVKKEFHRCEIVGRRFPICHVHVKGSVVEVSSFQTAAKKGKDKGKNISIHGCDKMDYVRWRDCLRRDFTINSLFFDPFVNKIYDYTNGMMDLRSSKLQTLVPAQMSFEEDCARILRGLRIAARLGLSFSKETDIAIRKHSPSIARLTKSRIMMELNYMMSYGSAESSLRLLRRFNLLDILLPFQAAYLAQQATCQGSMMLMKLFFNLDKLVTCDRPSDCSLWIGLLAFHLALVNHPQDPLAVWTFASVLYHGTWKEGVKFAREHAQALTSFIPEISEFCHDRPEDELAQRVTRLASLVQDSIGALTEAKILLQKMSRFPDFPCSSDLVFVPPKTGNGTAQLFSVLAHDVEHYDDSGRRKRLNIDYELLGKGNKQETRFVLGKIFMDTMSSSGVAREEESKLAKAEKTHKDDGALIGDRDQTGHVDKKRKNLPRVPVKRHKCVKEKRGLLENVKNSFANKELKKKDEHKSELIEKNELLQVAEKVVKKESRRKVNLRLADNRLPPDSVKQQQQQGGGVVSVKGVTENGKPKPVVVAKEKNPERRVLSSLFR